MGPPKKRLQEEGRPVNDQPFRTLIDLVTFDQELNKLYTHVEQLKIQKQELNHKQYVLQQEFDVVRQQLHDAQKNVNELEAHMKELEEQLQTKKGRLDTVSNAKEYQSITTEINTIRQEQHGLEQELVSVWHALETTQRMHDQKLKSYQEQMQELGQAQEKTGQAIDQLHAQMAEQERERVALEQKVPAEWLEKYAMMRARVVDPIVPVLDGSCGACFYAMTGQDMQELFKNKLLQCRGCYRFVYLQQEAPKEPVSQDSEK